MARYHLELEHELPESYSSAEYLVGVIQGTLAALGELGSYVNHAPTIGFLELDSSIDSHAALARIPALRGQPSIGCAISLSDALESLRRVLVDENELVASASWSREAALRIHALLASALSDLVRELELEPRALSVELNQNPIGYVSDASVVLISSRHRRAFVLAVGWSD